jgi:hypothetical protein
MNRATRHDKVQTALLRVALANQVLYFNNARCNFGGNDIAKRDFYAFGDTSVYGSAARGFVTVELGRFNEK